MSEWDTISKDLPILIENIDFSENHFRIEGADWSFGTTMFWRITKSNRIIIGCKKSDYRSGYINEHFIGNKIVSHSRGKYEVDHIFITEDGYTLEFFSSDEAHEWIYTKGKFAMGAGEDEALGFPVFA